MTIDRQKTKKRNSKVTPITKEKTNIKNKSAKIRGNFDVTNFLFPQFREIW